MAIHSEPIGYHIDVCAGSGMLGLGLKIALNGKLRTIAYVEREVYAAATLVARMEDETLDQAPIWDNVKTMRDPAFLEVLEGISPLVLSAGYPCQPFSQAGRRLGESDPRHLWPDIDAFIGIARPQLVFLENVPGHLRMGFGRVRRDLQRRGYRVAAGLFSAEEVGASHRRERLFVVGLADSDAAGVFGGSVEWGESDGVLPAVADGPSEGWCELHCERGGLGEGEASIERGGLPLFSPGPGERERWGELLQLDASVEPAICRVADGLANRLVEPRLRLTGNGVVPLVAAYAFATLASTLIHNSTKQERMNA